MNNGEFDETFDETLMDTSFVASTGEAFDATTAQMLIEHVEGRQYKVRLQVDQKLQRFVETQLLKGVQLKPGLLLQFDLSSKELELFPLVTYPSERLYRSKYRQLKRIKLPLVGFFDDQEPTTELIEQMLGFIPKGLIRDYRYGLGLIRELHPMLNSFEQLPGFECLEIPSQGHVDYQNGVYTLPEGEFQRISRAMSQITRKYQSDSLRDRRILAHNEMLHRLDPINHKLKEPLYEPGTVFKMLGGTRVNQTVLKGNDRKALLSAFAANAEAIAKRDPQEFVQLQKDIEVVSLDRLIDMMGRFIGRNVREAQWQKLLEANPFLLSMLFGQPIVLLQSGASVGGQTLAGCGTKIADFLTQHARSYNASIVELKRSGTALLLANDYRVGVYGPSNELTQAVVQVLDQRLKLINDVAGIKHRSRIQNLETYSVDCVIVAGLFPTEADRIASFEMYRSQLKDIRIITFDELFERVKVLREQLSGERYEGSIHDDDFPESEELEPRSEDESDFEAPF